MAVMVDRRGFLEFMSTAVAALGLPAELLAPNEATAEAARPRGVSADERERVDKYFLEKYDLLPDGWTVEEWYAVPPPARRLIEEHGVPQPGVGGWRVIYGAPDRGAGMFVLRVEPEDVGGTGRIELQAQARTEFDSSGRWYPIHEPRELELSGPTDVPMLAPEVGRVLARPLDRR